ncbi:hypothetical protein DFH06DRAFT_1321805 [Mycena polygramma]|nr:hypothetical protein DFH06DRAFT_1321805 [Mycena polygramma]
MSSRSSTAPIDDLDLHDAFSAMAQSTPDRPTTGAGNRCCIPHLVNQNVVVAARHYAEKKRLRVDQITEVEVFLYDPASLREAKLLSNILALANQVEKIVTGTPAYTPTAELETNLRKYAAAVLLSGKANGYKDNALTGILLGFVKKFGFGVPPGLENIPADWEKVEEVAQDALTRRRSRIKKQIRWSLKTNKNDAEDAPEDQHQDIFNLAKTIVKGTQCTVNAELCARIAVMRSVYLKYPGTNFWDRLDKVLAQIRREAGGDKRKLVKASNHPLTEDEGTNKTKIDDSLDMPVDEFQQQVDDLINIGAVDAASSV